MSDGATDLVIVGVDPGTTSGVAVLDVWGNLVNYTSRKNFSKDRILEFIVSNGKPLIVASDVSPPPSLVEEISSNTGTVLSDPGRDLSEERKDDLTADFGISGEDSHVKDALAAAEHARRDIASKVEDVRRRVNEARSGEYLEDVIELVFKGSLPVSAAISEVEKVAEPETGGKRTGGDRDWQSIAEKRKERIDLLETKVSNLEEHLNRVDAGNEPMNSDDVESEVRELRSDIKQKELAIEELQERIASLQQALERVSEGWMQIPKQEDLSNGDQTTVFVDDVGDEIDPEANHVLTYRPPDTAGSEDMVVHDLEELDGFVETERYLIVDPEELEEETDTEGFMEWLEDYRERRRSS